MKTVKIILFGAGSRSFSSGVIHDLCSEPAFGGDLAADVVLVDLDEAVLARRLAYARACAALSGRPLSFTATARREEALPGADFAILSVAVHRDALWEQDQRVGAACGFQQSLAECGGPAGAFHALRNYEIVMPICRDIERLCPKALVLNFTNPEARILTAILRTTRLRAVGLCHGFGAFFDLAARTLGRPRDELDIRTAGMNHFFTYYRIADRKTGQDLIPAFEAAFDARLDGQDAITRHLREKFGVVGYPHGTHTGEYFSGAYELQGHGFDFGTENRPIPRSGPIPMNSRAWDKSGDAPPARPEDIRPSGELAIGILADLALGRTSWRPAVNVLNTGRFIPTLAEDGCVEVPMTVEDGKIIPENVPPLPEAFAALIRLQHSIQKLVLEAYVHRSKKTLLQALLLDPVVHSPAMAQKYMDWMLWVQKEYLPEFS